MKMNPDNNKEEEKYSRQNTPRWYVLGNIFIRNKIQAEEAGHLSIFHWLFSVCILLLFIWECSNPLFKSGKFPDLRDSFLFDCKSFYDGGYGFRHGITGLP